MNRPHSPRSADEPSLDDIERMARAAFARLPEAFRALCADLVIRVDDFPTPEVMRTMRAGRYDLLGLFHGIGLPFRAETTGTMPNMIWLYRRPILLYRQENPEDSLENIVTHVLVHEIGHHFGFSDEDMDAIEDAATE